MSKMVKQRVYLGTDENLSDDWADYWQKEKDMLAELAAWKDVLLQRTYQSNRQRQLIVNNVRFAVVKPKLMRKEAQYLYEKTFEDFVPTYEERIPEIIKVKIDWEKVQERLGDDCPMTKEHYRGTPAYLRGMK